MHIWVSVRLQEAKQVEAVTSLRFSSTTRDGFRQEAHLEGLKELPPVMIQSTIVTPTMPNLCSNSVMEFTGSFHCEKVPTLLKAYPPEA